jgi:hypothetical protein
MTTQNETTETFGEVFFKFQGVRLVWQKVLAMDTEKMDEKEYAVRRLILNEIRLEANALLDQMKEINRR